MRVPVALALAVVLLLGGGCGVGGPTIFENPRGTIGVTKGDEFVIELRVNASVGYDWQLVPFDFEPTKVDLVKTETIYPDDNRAGQSGKRRYRFKATTVGRQTLVFQRVFRGKPTRRRVLTIEVRPEG
ncbi:MAG TPA: protease inhibitor I42 family protein [Thermoleophilaceae bacterium]|nr:protease inhibitor I42 family protein [Thermoleophilaceae bacterium]